MELWQIAKPFGRPAKFKSPQELWEAFIAYVEWSENNPITIGNERRQKQSAKRGEEKAQKKETAPRPFSLVAFRLHAGIKRDWATFSATYSKRNHDFCGVIQAIEESVRQQMVEQAMVGNYKENLVARLNGISDTVEQKVSGNIATRKSLSVQEARDLLDNIEKEI